MRILKFLIFSFGLLAIASPSAVLGSATWISLEDLQSAEFTPAQLFQGLQEIGITTVYVNAWTQGRALFPSPTYRQMINGGVTANYLKIVIDEAKARKIRVIAWFEYGFAMHHKSIGNPPKFYENTKAKGWHLGFDPRTGFEWLNPAHPDVVKFLGQMMLDCLDMYPYISGVQIDDHFAYPAKWSQGQPAVLTHAVCTISSVLKAKHPSKTLSVSPHYAAWALKMYGMDWVSWIRSGFVQEAVVQTYYASAQKFQASILQSKQKGGPGKISVGIAASIGGRPVSPALLTAKIQFVKRQGFSIVLWHAGDIIKPSYKSLVGRLLRS